MSDELVIKTDINLSPNDVALVIKEDGDIQITHNIASVIETGMMQGGKDAAGLIMAMTFRELLLGDEPAYFAAMRRVVGRLDGGSLKLVQ